MLKYFLLLSSLCILANAGENFLQLTGDNFTNWVKNGNLITVFVKDAR
jgi:hypothetical protein